VHFSAPARGGGGGGIWLFLARHLFALPVEEKPTPRAILGWSALQSGFSTTRYSATVGDALRTVGGAHGSASGQTKFLLPHTLRWCNRRANLPAW
jgi:hypothetical protein